MTRPDSKLVQQLTKRLEELAGITDEGPGVTRPGFSAVERRAHALIGEWAVEEGASVDVDPAGNTVITYREGEPYLLLGSHLDSVPAGGRFDGAAGVVAALQAAHAVRNDLDLGVRVVAFTCEEGAAFSRPCLGSELATGELDPELLTTLHNSEKRSVMECAEGVGLRPQDCPDWLAAPSVAAFLELHIEQAEVLEAARVPIGVVDTIAGTARIAFSCQGRADHAGATPMRLRADALAGVSQLVLSVETIAREARSGVATIGRLEIEPNVVTTIAAEVRGVIDIRDYTDPVNQKAMVDEIQEAARQVAYDRGLDVELRLLSWREPIVLSAWPRRALKEACTQLATPFRVMPSGAGHDAAITARKVPTAMVFVPTPGGLSHVPDEDCRIDDLATGARVLSAALVRLDSEARGETVQAA